MQQGSRSIILLRTDTVVHKAAIILRVFLGDEQF